MKKIRNIIFGVFLCGLAMLIFPMNGEAAKAKLNKTNVTMTVGQQRKLKVKNTDKQIKWKSSKKKVAKVSKTGVVTAKREGTTVVTAKFGKKKLSCKVQVKEKPELRDKSVNICIGKKQTLAVMGTAKKVTWHSSDKKIVKVSKKGVIKGVKKGQATITAKVGNKKLTCKVRVKAAVKKSDYVFEVANEDMLGMVYHSDSIAFHIADETIAKAVMIDYGYDIEEMGNSADIIVYGIKDGETTITITNNCNSESVSFKIVVKKPTEDTAEQKLIDYIIQNGEFDEFGDLYITDGYTTISYSGAEKYVAYLYMAEVDGCKVEWVIMEDVWDAKNGYFVMWIHGNNPIDDYVTAKFVKETYNGEELVFEDAWFGTPAKEEYQGIANKTTRQALSEISKLLNKAGLGLSDIGFAAYEV